MLGTHSRSLFATVATLALGCQGGAGAAAGVGGAGGDASTGATTGGPSVEIGDTTDSVVIAEGGTGGGASTGGASSGGGGTGGASSGGASTGGASTGGASTGGAGGGASSGGGGTGGAGGGVFASALALSGTITELDGTPISGARVSLAANDAVNDLTGADGVFTLTSDEPTGRPEPPLFPAMRPVEHTVIAQRAGYVSTFRGVPGAQAVGLTLPLRGALPSSSTGNGYDGTPFVALYLGDRIAAVTMTFDDTVESQLTTAKPLFDLYGYKATFFLTSSYIGPTMPTTWPMWQAVVQDGYEIGNHGRIHWVKPECTPENDAWNRDTIIGGYVDIEASLGVPPRAFAFPAGGLSDCTTPIVLEAGHVDWRRADHVLANDRLYPEGDNLTVADGLDAIDTVLAHTPTWNGATLSWLLFYMHDVTAPRAAVLQAMLDHIREHDDLVWAAGYGQVTIYERERELSTLEVLQRGPRSVMFRLSNTLDPAVFSQPVTVVLPLPSGTVDVRATAFRDAAAGPVVVRARADRLWVDLVPGAAPVYVTW